MLFVRNFLAMFTNVNQAPVALDIRSSMDLVYELFAKLGLRYICVLKDGKYAGMVSGSLRKRV
jgi:hypothetical protein